MDALRFDKLFSGFKTTSFTKKLFRDICPFFRFFILASSHYQIIDRAVFFIGVQKIGAIEIIIF